MALPIILFNSSTGSDTAASGAGPATALTGTANASTDATGTVVTLGGSPNLSGVATDGSAALWLNTSSGRKWAAISAVDNTAKTVTVTSVYTPSLTGQTWAIGGTRKSLAGSIKLYQNDIIPGWYSELQDGYAETLANPINPTVAGTYYFLHTIRAAANVTTRPKFTITNGSTAFTSFSFAVNYWRLSGIDIYTDYVPTVGVDFTRAIDVGNQVHGIVLEDCRILGGTTGGFMFGVFYLPGGSGVCSQLTLRDCEFSDPSGTMTNGGVWGVSAGGAFGPPYETILKVQGCRFYDIPGPGINIASVTPISSEIVDCVFDNCTVGVSLDLSSDSPTTNVRGGMIVRNNTFVGCSSHGMFAKGATLWWEGFSLQNNIFRSNGGYGFYQDSSAAGYLNSSNSRCGGNLFYGNTSGDTNVSVVLPRITTTVDPALKDVTNNDYTPGAAVVGTGDPNWDIGAARGYAIPGAIQRKSATVRRGILSGGRM